MDTDEITEYAEAYQKQLEIASQGCKSKQELRDLHEQIAAEIEQEFVSKCPPPEDEEEEEVASNVLQLRVTLLEILEEIIEINEWSEELNAETQPLPKQRKKRALPGPTLEVKTFRKLYFEEVDKHLKQDEFVEPSELQNIHETASSIAMEKCRSSQQHLTESQEERLKKVAEESFEIFKTRNQMLLNWNTDSEPAIGIDLGTTFSCVGVFLQGKVIIIPNSIGQQTTPSYVRLEKDGKVTVGLPAKKNAYKFPDATIFDAKRLIGRSFEDPIVQEDIKMWPFDVKKGASGPIIFVNEKEYPPEQISAYLLQHLKKEAEEFLKCPVKKAVITVPAYFNDAQRQATIDAGEMAGLQVLTILNEPTAAAMAYKMERFHEDTKKVLIFDFGGGTFDVALLETSGTKIEVISVDGDSHLGGEDVDRSLMIHCAKELGQLTEVDLLEDRNSENKVKKDKARECLRRIQSHCEESKIELSVGMSSEIVIDHLIDDHEMSVSISREEMETLNEEIIEKIFTIIDRLLTSAKVDKNEIDDIILVGGSTRIPMVQQELKMFFNAKPLNYTINPDEAVAYGAAIHAAILNGSLEAKKVLNSTIQDVTPMSLGIECTLDDVPGVFDIIIPKDTKIPARRVQHYETVDDDQTGVKIQIYQGENEVAVENTLLGEFSLDGIPPAPAGEEKHVVFMEIGANGVLKVTAISKSTKGAKSLTIEENRGQIPRELKEEITTELSQMESDA